MVSAPILPGGGKLESAGMDVVHTRKRGYLLKPTRTINPKV